MNFICTSCGDFFDVNGTTCRKCNHTICMECAIIFGNLCVTCHENKCKWLNPIKRQYERFQRWRMNRKTFPENQIQILIHHNNHCNN
jgi:hypothetical protein